jgi:hypothetical protein
MKQLINYTALLSVLLFWLPLQSKAQINVELATSKFNTYESIASFNIRNATIDAIAANVRVTLSEDAGGNVFTINWIDVLLKPGLTPSLSFDNKARTNFYNTSVSNYLKANDKLADGNYRICYSVAPTKAGILPYEYCTVFAINNAGPLLLISPINGEQLCNERPTFQWQNPMPLPVDAKVKLTLVEMQPGQNETEAMVRNMPLVNIMETSGSFLEMPSFVKELKENTSYAWQVTVYNKGGIIKKSEIWVFKKSCSMPKEEKTSDAFRQLKPQFDGNYYLVKDKILFYFTNAYSTEKLDYAIIDIETNTPIKYYPAVPIHTGVNNIEIDIDDCQGLKKGKYYLLKAMNVYSSALQMRFKLL